MTFWQYMTYRVMEGALSCSACLVLVGVLLVGVWIVGRQESKQKGKKP